jgi:hypothetical protein
MTLDEWLGRMPRGLRKSDIPEKARNDWTATLKAWVHRVVEPPAFVDLIKGKLVDDVRPEPYQVPLRGATVEWIKNRVSAPPKTSTPHEIRVREDELRRALLLHRALAERCGEGAGCWPVEWAPTPGSSASKEPVLAEQRTFAEDTSGLLDRLAWIRRRAIHPYSMVFPVIVGTQENGYLIRCALTVLRTETDGDPLPRVALAPWSFFIQSEGDRAELQETLRGLAESSETRFDFLRGSRVLIDLQPVENCAAVLPPEPKNGDVAIREQSLGLAVVTAAWACTRHPLFRRMVLTGVADVDAIKQVNGIETKYKAALAYAASLEAECAFVVPKHNENQVYAELKAGVQIITVGDWGDYFNKVESKLFGDGFDWYRSRPKPDRAAFQIAIPAEAAAGGVVTDDFGHYLESDVLELEFAVGQLLRSEAPAFLPVVLPFGNDPAVAARYIVAKLCGALREQSGAGHHFAYETATPVLFPLSPRGLRDRGSPAEAMLADVKTWSPDEPTAEQQDLVRDTFRRFPHRFLLVVYGAPSTRSDGYESDDKTIAELESWVREAPSQTRPRICFVASDDHHHRYLADRLQKIAET